MPGEVVRPGGTLPPGGAVPGGSMPGGGGFIGSPRIVGGLTERRDPNAPAVIESEEIVFFSVSCWFSSVAASHKYEYVAGSAVKCEAGAVAALCWKNEPYGEFQGNLTAVVSDEIFSELQRIVKEKDLVRNNGLSHIVGGLAPIFGGSIDIRYASGEYIRTDNNQSAVISPDTGEAIAELLKKAIEESQIPGPSVNDISAVSFFEDRGDNDYTRLRLEGTHFTSDMCFGPEEGKHFLSEREVSPKVMEKLRKIAAAGALLTMDGLFEDAGGFYVNRAEAVTFTMQDGSEHTINNRMKLPGEAGNSIFRIRLLLEYKLDEEGDSHEE